MFYFYEAMIVSSVKIVTLSFRCEHFVQEGKLLEVKNYIKSKSAPQHSKSVPCITLNVN